MLLEILISLEYEDIGRGETYTFVSLEEQGYKEKANGLVTGETNEWDISWRKDTLVLEEI